jgi:hypothetical protein
MMRADFVAQMDNLKRRARLAFYGGGALAILFNVSVVWYVFYRYPPGTPNQAALVWYLAGLSATSVTAVIFFVLIRKLAARHAPVCPGCGARATWRERPEILSSGCCPRCGAEFVR